MATATLEDITAKEIRQLCDLEDKSGDIDFLIGYALPSAGLHQRIASLVFPDGQNRRVLRFADETALIEATPSSNYASRIPEEYRIEGAYITLQRIKDAFGWDNHKRTNFAKKHANILLPYGRAKGLLLTHFVIVAEEDGLLDDENIDEMLPRILEQAVIPDISPVQSRVGKKVHIYTERPKIPQYLGVVENRDDPLPADEIIAGWLGIKTGSVTRGLYYRHPWIKTKGDFEDYIHWYKENAEGITLKERTSRLEHLKEILREYYGGSEPKLIGAARGKELTLRPGENLATLVAPDKPVIQEKVVDPDHPVSEAYERYILGRGKLSLYEIALQQMARGEYPLDQEGVLIYHPSDKRFAEEVIIKDEATGKYKAIGRAVFHIKERIGTIVDVGKDTIDINTQAGIKHYQINSKNGDLSRGIWGLPLDDYYLCDGAKSMLDRLISADSQKKIYELARGNNKLHMLLTYVQKRVPGYDGILNLVADLYKGPLKFVEEGAQNRSRIIRLLDEKRSNNLGALTIMGLVTSEIVDNPKANSLKLESDDASYRWPTTQYTLNKAVAVPK